MSSAALLVSGVGVLVGLVGLVIGLVLARRSRSRLSAGRGPQREDEPMQTTGNALSNALESRDPKAREAVLAALERMIIDQGAGSEQEVASSSSPESVAAGVSVPELPDDPRDHSWQGVPDRELARRSVIVTAASQPAAIAAIRSLHAAGHRVVAGDVDPQAAGMILSDERGVIAPVSDPGFIASICGLGLRTQSNALLVMTPREMPPLIARRSSLEAAGLETWLPPLAALEICLDRWRFAQVLSEGGIPCPATSLGGAGGVPGPWVVRPRYIQDHDYARVVEDEADLAEVLEHVPEPVVQSRMNAREFIVDALVGRDGVLAGAVPRWRLAGGSGAPAPYEVTFSDAGLVEALVALIAAVGLDGQLSVSGTVDEEGAITFVEMTPHFSDGLLISTAAGADLMGEYLRGVFGLPIRSERLQFRAEVGMARYLAEACSPAPVAGGL